MTGKRYNTRVSAALIVLVFVCFPVTSSAFWGETALQSLGNQTANVFCSWFGWWCDDETEPEPPDTEEAPETTVTPEPEPPPTNTGGEDARSEPTTPPVTNFYPTEYKTEVVERILTVNGSGVSKATLDTELEKVYDHIYKQAGRTADNDDYRNFFNELSGPLTVTEATSLSTLGVSSTSTLATLTATQAAIGTTTLRDTLTLDGALYLAATTPAQTASRLYNQSGALYWNGSLVTSSTTGNWSGNGTDVFRLTGNVGIGTSTPEEQLHVVGRTKATGQVQVDNSSGAFSFPLTLFQKGNDVGSAAIYMQGSTGDSKRIYADGDNDLIGFADNVGTLMVIQNGGIVGVSDYSPDAHLEVSASGESGGNIFLLSSDDDNDGDLLTVTESGNVGIGTTTPETLLHVGGAASTVLNGTEVLFVSGDNAPGGLEVRNTFAGSFGDARISTVANDGSYISIAQPSTANNLSLFGLTRASTSLIFNSAGLEGGASRDLAIGTVEAQSLILGTNNLERFRIDSDGNVGIGTTDPGNLLEVYGASNNAFAEVSVEASGSATRVAGLKLTDHYGGQWTIQTDGNTSGLQVKDGASERLTIDNSGNVGIGTTSPGAKLQINTGAAGTTGLIIQDASNQTAPLTTWLRSDDVILAKMLRTGLQIGNDSTYGLLSSSGGLTIGNGSAASTRLTQSGNDIYFQNTVSSGDVYFTGYNGADLTGDVIFKGTGNVGIGTTDPDADLHVDSDGSVLSTGTEVLRLSSNLGWATVGSGPMLKFTGTNVGDSDLASIRAYAFETDAVGLAFDTGYPTLSTKMVIHENGNVGIGTTEPQSKLDVFLAANTLTSFGVTSNANGNYSGIHLGYKEHGNLTYRKGGIVFETLGDANGRGKIHILNNGTANNSTVGLSDARLTVNYDGNVGIGTTTPSYKLTVAGTAAFIGLTNDGTGYYACVNATTGELSTSTTACGASSERFKEDIEDLSYGLETVLELRPVSFNWKDDFIPSDVTQIGFIAEEVDLLIPEVVGRGPDGEIQNVDYPKLVTVVVNAIKELWSEITGLKAKDEEQDLVDEELREENAELRDRIEALEAVLDIEYEEPAPENDTNVPGSGAKTDQEDQTGTTTDDVATTTDDATTEGAESGDTSSSTPSDTAEPEVIEDPAPTSQDTEPTREAPEEDAPESSSEPVVVEEESTVSEEPEESTDTPAPIPDSPKSLQEAA